MDNSKIELSLAFCRGSITSLNLENWQTDWDGLKECLSKPKIASKDGAYFIRCAGKIRSNKETAEDAFILILDGDLRIGETGEILSGAPEPDKVHEVLTSLDVTHLIYSSHSNNATKKEIGSKNSGGLFGADFHKYRVVIPCHYRREQLPIILDYLFSKLAAAGVMLVNVSENKTWSQAWFFPRVPDQSRFDSFKFLHFEGNVLNAEAVTQAWVLDHPSEPQKPKNQNQQAVLSPSLSIEAFNKKYSVTEILLKNGYQKIGDRFLRPNSESGIPGVKLLINEGGERAYSHGGDVLNDGYAHDAFDVFCLLEHGGDKAKACAFLRNEEKKIDRRPEQPPLSAYEADYMAMGQSSVAVGTLSQNAGGINATSKPSRAESILNTIPDNVVDIITALPKIAEHCVKSNVSEFEIVQIIEGLCKRFGQKDKKTVLAKTLKSQIKNYRQQTFQQASIAFGSVPIQDIVPKNSFPNSYLVDGNIRLDTTVENLQNLLFAHGISVEYDVLLKTEVLNFPDGVIGGHTDLANEAGVQMIRSLSSKSGLSMTAVEFLPILLDGNPRNHILEWIESKPHDETDRITTLANTITVPESVKTIWPKVLNLWLMQCVAAADGGERTTNKDAIPKYESVLVFTGQQGANKTSWINQLVPPDLKRYIQDGMHLKVGSRDSEKIATSFWIVELGELDATFRKSDIANLKAFLSRRKDTMRMAYAKRECSFTRRTSFAASVNEHRFLTDMTGNRRFWPIEVLKIEKHTIDMQQLWKQVFDNYLKEEAAWWATPDLEEELKKLQEEHTEICNVEDALITFFYLSKNDWTAEELKLQAHLSCKEIATMCGLDGSQKNLNKIGALMRKNGFIPQKINGKSGYRIAETKHLGPAQLSDTKDKMN
ncbi:MAG: VapE domain-containing protein [Methylococcaceae bacterium]